jgi:hypothetical protein
MASGSPEHHMDRLGLRLGDRFCNFVLAAEERLGSSSRTRDRTRPMLRRCQKVLAKASAGYRHAACCPVSAGWAGQKMSLGLT